MIPTIQHGKKHCLGDLDGTKQMTFLHIYIWAPHCFTLPMTMIDLFCVDNNFIVIDFVFSIKLNFVNFTICHFVPLIFFHIFYLLGKMPTEV
jgi:hypothetical protein